MKQSASSNNHAGAVATDLPDDFAQALELLATHAPFRVSSRSNQPRGFAAPGRAGCPEVEAWLRLAGGEVQPQQRTDLLTHAALCTECLVCLRECQRVLAVDPTSEETSQLRRFHIGSAQWIGRMALELAETPYLERESPRGLRLVWISCCVAAVLIALAAALWWQRRDMPERLLAQAYTQSRSFDLRIPGAAYAPFSPATHGRSVASGAASAPLLAAKTAIERKLQQSPADPRSLQLQARAEVLQQSYDTAIDRLDRLLAAGPVTADLLMDDGTAYYLRGMATGNENDRATALEDLQRADELAPNDPVILFNEAIVMEDRGQVMNAVETWNRFLQFERDPKWHEEGQTRLDTLTSRLGAGRHVSFPVRRDLSPAAKRTARSPMLLQFFRPRDFPAFVCTRLDWLFMQSGKMR